MNTIKSRSARRAVQLVLATGVAVGAVQPALADDVFLKITGLPGGSVDSKHKDEIDVLSFSQSVSSSGSAAVGSGAGAGKAACPQFSITKPVDQASPGLAEAASSGRVLPSATLVVRNNADKAQEYYKVTMSMVYVLASSQGFSGEGGGYEGVVLAARTTSMSYQPQKPDGSLGTAVVRTINCSSPGA